MEDSASRPPLLRPQLLAAGWSDGDLRRRRRAGELVPLQCGAYLEAADERLADAAARRALLVAAGGPLPAEGVVVSHVSAAVLHGMPVWNVALDRVHRTRPRRTGARIGTSAHLHRAPPTAEEIVEIGGRSVISAARTLVDVARTVGFEEAVAMLDAALDRRLVDRAALDHALARAVGWRGAPGARRAVVFADGLTESIGESRSRVAMARHGVPAPVVRGLARGVVGPCRLAWPRLRVVGEFDGRVEYGKHLRPGQDLGAAVFEERRREDRIRDEGLRVVRWTWADLRDFAVVAARLHRAFAVS